MNSVILFIGGPLHVSLTDYHHHSAGSSSIRFHSFIHQAVFQHRGEQIHFIAADSLEHSWRFLKNVARRWHRCLSHLVDQPLLDRVWGDGRSALLSYLHVDSPHIHEEWDDAFAQVTCPYGSNLHGTIQWGKVRYDITGIRLYCTQAAKRCVK